MHHYQDNVLHTILEFENCIFLLSPTHFGTEDNLVPLNVIVDEEKCMLHNLN